ncbi:MAG: hypothetical protein AB1589_33945 [Cyanobacteriota bacterium]
MIQNTEIQLQHKQEACPEGLQPKPIQEIREETENELGTTNQEIDARFCNLKASKEIDKYIEEELKDECSRTT